MTRSDLIGTQWTVVEQIEDRLLIPSAGNWVGHLNYSMGPCRSYLSQRLTTKGGVKIPQDTLIEGYTSAKASPKPLGMIAISQTDAIVVLRTEHTFL